MSIRLVLVIALLAIAALISPSARAASTTLPDHDTV